MFHSQLPSIVSTIVRNVVASKMLNCRSKWAFDSIQTDENVWDSFIELSRLMNDSKVVGHWSKVSSASRNCYLCCFIAWLFEQVPRQSKARGIWQTTMLLKSIKNIGNNISLKHSHEIQIKWIKLCFFLLTLSPLIQYSIIMDGHHRCHIALLKLEWFCCLLCSSFGCLFDCQLKWLHGAVSCVSLFISILGWSM